MPSCCCRCPTGDEVKSTLKTLGSAAMGMIAALALNEAMEATFRELDLPTFIYAILISLFAIFSIALIKRKLEGWANRKFGERGRAILTLFKIAFCLLSASAWQDVINAEKEDGSGSTNVWILLLIAAVLTVFLVLFLILAFRTKEWWDSSTKCCSCRPKCCRCLDTFIDYFLFGLVAWVPITFGVVSGIAWNEFFEELIKSIFSDGSLIIVIWVYALLTVPLAILIVVLTQHVFDQGVHPKCCTVFTKPCCGLENKVAEPLSGMFEGEAAAIMAFAWDGAVRITWYEISRVGDDDKDEATGEDAPEVDGKWWLILIYAVVATIICTMAVIFTKQCVRRARQG